MSEVRTPPRKLVDLNPTFWRYHGIDREGMGVMFDCPCGSESCENGSVAAVQLTGTGACMVDCLHADDISAFVAEKGLDKRPAGK